MNEGEAKREMEVDNKVSSRTRTRLIEGSRRTDIKICVHGIFGAV